MPGADWWDEGGDRPVSELLSLEVAEMKRDAETFRWLCNMLRGHDLWMDGTAHWNLPLSVLSGIRARTPMEAIQKAYERSQAKNDKPLPQ